MNKDTPAVENRNSAHRTDRDEATELEVVQLSEQERLVQSRLVALEFVREHDQKTGAVSTIAKSLVQLRKKGGGGVTVRTLFI